MTATFLDGARRATRSLRHPTGALWALTALAVAMVLVFLFTDLPGKWEYALGLRTRTIAGMVIAAAAVGASTVLFQTITANRILTPGIMGFDAVFLAIQTLVAFAIGPALLVSAPPLASWLVELVLMAGSIVLLYWWLFLRRRLDLHVIVLAGLVLGVLFRSVTGFLQRLLDPDTFAILQDLTFASFTSVDRELLLPTGILVAVALGSLWPIRRELDVLSLGESTAISLGVAHRRVVMHVIVAIAAMVAASTALVGPVTFFGLIVANLAYGAVGHRHLRSVPAAIAIGVIALVGGQLILSRLLGFGTELPGRDRVRRRAVLHRPRSHRKGPLMIRTDSVVKRHGSLVAVDDVSIDIRPGVTAIIGPNGAGKSTLLAAIGRLVGTDGGVITVDGLDVTATRSRELARRLAILRQDNHLAIRLSVEDLVAYGRFPHGGSGRTPDDRAHVDDAIELLDLDEVRGRFLDELSGGQRQRAFVAMALAQDTDHLLLDEPLNNLDPRHGVGAHEARAPPRR